MDLAPVHQSLLDSYLAAFDPLTGDERTGRTFRGTVQGILGAESLTCSRIAAFSPQLSTDSTNGAQRVRRMAKGETTQRSDLDVGYGSRVHYPDLCSTTPWQPYAAVVQRVDDPRTPSRA